MKAKVLMLSGLLLVAGCQSPTPTTQRPEPETSVGENENSQIPTTESDNIMDQTFIGVVENGRLRVLLPKSVGTRFTAIGMQMAVSPETGELDLTEYEGSATAIQGHDGGSWVYSARVIDTGGPIVTALVRQALKQ
jgi:hypothetical protein